MSLLNTLSKRWMLHILKSIGEGRVQFNDIKRSIPGISAKILSERLSDLEYAGFIERAIVSEKPIRTVYSFTEYGKSLQEELMRVNNWAIRHKEEIWETA